jgi:uncharacterized protein YcnI
MIRRFVLAAALCSTALLASAGPALAHIDPNPVAAPAGSQLTVAFTVEHGCEGSPTVRLDMRLPDGVTNATPEPLPGWDESVEVVDGDTIVTFAGGPLADDAEGTFEVAMTLPPTPDTTIYFPFVQRCEDGEIRWIGIPATPGDELDEPAPAMELTGSVVPEPTAVPAPETTTRPTPVPTSTESAVTETTTDETNTTDTTAVADETSPETSDGPDTSGLVLLSTGIDEPAGPATGTIGFIVTMVVVAGLTGFVVFRVRRAQATNSSDAD